MTFHPNLLSTVFKFQALICPFAATMATLSFLTGCAAALNNISHLSRALNGENFLSGRNLLTAWGMNLTSLLLLLLQLPSLPTIVIKVHSFSSVFKSACFTDSKSVKKYSAIEKQILSFDDAQNTEKCPKKCVHFISMASSDIITNRLDQFFPKCETTEPAEATRRCGKDTSRSDASTAQLAVEKSRL